MGRLTCRKAASATAAPATGMSCPAARPPALRGVAAVAAAALVGLGTSVTGMAGLPIPLISPGMVSGTATAVASSQPSYRSIILPDLLIVAPKGLTGRQIAMLRGIAAVRNMITFDGAEIRAGGRPVSVIGVNPVTFRSWVPLQTASDQAFWSALQRGEFVASKAARARLGLRRGTSYQLRGSTTQSVQFGAAASLGIGGVDLLVNPAVSARLGLVHRVAALINAPGGSLTALIRKVRRILGPTGEIVSLRSQQLPVARVTSGQQPSSYLQLFMASAADYCPGLSWTVLAAIGQIESADGTNNGPSTAGALGPMQFLPSTWALWGIDAFGQTGPPDVMNPYDAVPSAARLLCADGATDGTAGLRAAIFDYNHAEWYVNEVLALAAEYAADYH
jgi:Transglycosylase SLT domain